MGDTLYPDACSNGAHGGANGAKPLTEEQRELRCQNLFTEYLSTTDVDEAVLTAQEIVTPGELDCCSTILCRFRPGVHCNGRCWQGAAWKPFCCNKRAGLCRASARAAAALICWQEKFCTGLPIVRQSVSGNRIQAILLRQPWLLEKLR